MNPAIAPPNGKMVLTSVDDGQGLAPVPDGNGSSLWSTAVPMGMWRLTVEPGFATHKRYDKRRYVNYNVMLPWSITLDAV